MPFFLTLSLSAFGQCPAFSMCGNVPMSGGDTFAAMTKNKAGVASTLWCADNVGAALALTVNCFCSDSFVHNSPVCMRL